MHVRFITVYRYSIIIDALYVCAYQMILVFSKNLWVAIHAHTQQTIKGYLIFHFVNFSVRFSFFVELSRHINRKHTLNYAPTRLMFNILLFPPAYYILKISLYTHTRHVMKCSLASNAFDKIYLNFEMPNAKFECCTYALKCRMQGVQQHRLSNVIENIHTRTQQGAVTRLQFFHICIDFWLWHMDTHTTHGRTCSCI